MNPTAYIGFGANLGDRESAFVAACDALNELAGTVVARCSSLYETAPVGLSDDGPRFLNAVIAVETDLEPDQLMRELRGIERLLGKDPTHRSDRSRIVDLDLLLYGELLVKGTDWEVPHPRMHRRAFVLVPLAEVAPLAYVPDVCCTVSELLEEIPHIERKDVCLFAFSVAAGG